MNETDPPVSSDPIVYRPSTFGRHDAAVRYVEGLIQTRAPFPGSGRFADAKPGAWGLLASGDTISARSGLALGSGTVNLLTQDGATLTDTGQSVTVYNAGVAITTSYGDKVVGLEWTEAGWSACECESKIPCSPCSIPKADLTVSWTGAGGVDNGSAVSHYDGALASKTGCITMTISGSPFPLHGIFFILCTFGAFDAGFAFEPGCGGPAGSGCATGGDHPGFGTMTLADYTCSPFHVHLHVDFPGCDELEGIITDLYFDE